MTIQDLTNLRKTRYLEVLETQKKFIQDEVEHCLKDLARDLSEGKYDNDCLKDGIERTFEIGYHEPFLNEVITWCKNYFDFEHIEIEFPNPHAGLSVKIKF